VSDESASNGTIGTTAFLSPKRVRLFGWIVAEIRFAHDDSEKVVKGPTSAVDADAVANIQAFSADGKYTPLRAPALFLVKADKGVPVADAPSPTLLGLTQIDAGTTFSPDLMFWTYDRDASIMRLDTSAGTVQRVVVDMEGSSGSQTRRVDTVGQESSWLARFGIDH
jgi:hypothetical protein